MQNPEHNAEQKAEQSSFKPLRIIQVINVRWFNATAWYALFLARLLKEAGHEVLVIGLKDTESFAKAQEWGLEPIHLDLNSKSPLTWLKDLAKIKKIIHDFKPDLVNCHRGEGFIFWALLKKLTTNYALVRTRGDQRLPKNNFPNRILHQTLADAIISTNSNMTKYFLETMQINPSRVSTIIGGVDKNKFYPDLKSREKMRAELGYTPQDLVLGLLGRFDLVKGQKELLAALGRLHKKGDHHIRLLLLGFSSATSQEEVSSWIKAEQLEEQVIITGKKDNINEYLQAVDLAVVPSLWSETIARATLEFMACEIPVIGSKVGVMPDLLSKEALFKPARIGELELMLEHCSQNPNFIQKIKEQQKQTIAKLSSVDFLNATLKVYEKALASKKN